MNFFDELRSWFIKAANVFLNLALDAYSWPIVGGWLGDGFAALVDFASECAYALWQASNWYEDTVDALRDILSWSNIRNLIRSWLEGIETAIAWFSNAFSNVVSIADAWWAPIWSNVQEFIAAATQGFDELKAAWDNFWNVTWPGLLADITGLEGEWDNFWKVTFPTLVSFKGLETWWNSTVIDVNKLIEDTIKVWFPFYDSLSELWDGIEKFFTDPLKWLYDRVEDFMDRYW